MESDQVDALAAHVRAVLPADGPWKTPDGYPNSLALCVLDSIWSIGVNYDRHVVSLLARYRKIATDSGRNADADTPDDLVTTVERCGGPDAFAELVRSRHRTSSKNGILKAQAVLEAGQLLRANNIATARDLTTREAQVKPGWYRIRGQGSGVSWKYFLMLAGIDGIKPDRMIHGFITEALGVTVTNDEAVNLLTRVQRDWPGPRPTLLELDHAIWRHQSGRFVT